MSVVLCSSFLENKSKLIDGWAVVNWNLPMLKAWWDLYMRSEHVFYVVIWTRIDLLIRHTRPSGVCKYHSAHQTSSSSSSTNLLFSRTLFLKNACSVFFWQSQSKRHFPSVCVVSKSCLAIIKSLERPKHEFGNSLWLLIFYYQSATPATMVVPL